LGAVLRNIKGIVATETGQAYARSIELWERLGSPSGFLHIPYGKAYHHAFRAEFDLPQRLAEALLGFGNERNDPVGLFLGHFSSGLALMHMRRFSLSRSHLERALGLYDRHSAAHWSIGPGSTRTGLHGPIWRMSFSLSAIRRRR
jgi:hypothetical protein